VAEFLSQTGRRRNLFVPGNVRHSPNVDLTAVFLASMLPAWRTAPQQHSAARLVAGAASWQGM